ncbi:MAG TPA: PAS domain S-box protein, partial [Anaerolineae bacterium]|nr:PAS domain S-box protein [Anaerolineae bacterium]
MIGGEDRQGGNQSKDGHEDDLDAWMRLVPDVCLLTDESGTIEAANGPAAEMLRVPQDALAGRSILDFVESSAHGDGKLRARIAALEEGEQLVEDVMLRCDKRDLVAVRLRVLRSSRSGRARLHWLMRGDVKATADRQAGEALLQDEAKLRAVFRSLVEGVVFLNTEGQVEEMNDAVQRRHGHTLEELADPKLDPRYHILRPDGSPFPADEQPAIVALRTGEAVRDVEMGVPTRDGRIRWRLVNAQPVYDDGNNLLGAVASFFDITQHKEAEQALRESEQEQRQLTRSLDLERRRLAALLENLPVGVWVSDEQGRLIEKNKEADAIWAGDAPLAVGMDEYTQYVARDAATGKVLAPEEYPTARVLATGRRVGPVEVDIRRFDGTEGTVLVSVVPIEDEQGKLVGTVGINVDITARKRGEAALRESEERFSVVFAKAPFAINLARLEDGTVVEVNEAWEALTGFTREEAIDKTSVELGLKPNPEMRARVMSAVQTGRPVRKVEMPFATRSGMSRVVSVSVDVVKVGGVEYLL